MSWTQLAISILTILISGVSAYLGAKRGKTASFRQALYAKQIEAVSELSVATYKLLALDSSEDFKSAINDFWLIRRKWSAYLPNEVEKALTHFLLVTGAANNQKLQLSMSLNLDPEKIGERIELADRTFSDRQVEAFFDVEEAFRKLMGVEPLSRETLALFPFKPSDRHNPFHTHQ